MGAANGTIGGPPYACIFMDKVETGFHEFQKQTDGLFCYIDGIIFISTRGEKEFQ